MKKQVLSITSLCFFTLVLLVCTNMGTGEKYATGPNRVEPAFAALAEKQGSFSGKLFDGSTSASADVFNLSFYGHTTIGGILKESDDSVNTLDLSKIKEINIEIRNYDSQRYRDKELTLASVVSTNGTVTEGLLFPRRITVCGEEKDSKMKRAWFISKLDKIEVDHPSAKAPEPEKSAPVATPEKAASEKTEQQPDIASKTENTEKTVATPKEKTTSVTTTATKANASGVTNSDLDEKRPKGVVESFMGIVDAIIDFVKSIIRFFINLVH